MPVAFSPGWGGGVWSTVANSRKKKPNRATTKPKPSPVRSQASSIMKNQTRKLIVVALVAALVLIIGWKQSTGQATQQGKQTVLKWEYTVIYISRERSHVEELNTLGTQGWEVCAAFSEGTGDRSGKVILRRPKAESTTTTSQVR